MHSIHPPRRAGLLVAALVVLGALAVLAATATGAKKKTTSLKDGRYTFKDTAGRKNTMTVSGGGKKVRFTIVHFAGGIPGEFPDCDQAVVSHGTYTLKRDYVDKTKLAFGDADLYSRKAPAVEPDGSAGGGMSANGTIDPRKLKISGQFPIRLQDIAGGIPTCSESPTAAETKLTRVK